MVAVDKRTRYPEVAKTHSTAQPTMEKLKTMFATHGTSRLQLESDNALPFNSNEFAEFAITEGFHNHCVTPKHACTNGEAESFMKCVQ